MTTLLAHSERDDRSLAPILTAMLLAPRSVLPRAGNERDPIPTELNAAKKRASIVSKKADPFGALVPIGECDLRDGCLLEDVAAPYRQLIAHYECIARGVAHHDERPLLVRIHREQRTKFRAGCDELRVAADPTDAAALADAIRDCDREIAALISVREGCETQLARVRLASHRRMALV